MTDLTFAVPLNALTVLVVAAVCFYAPISAARAWQQLGDPTGFGVGVLICLGGISLALADFFFPSSAVGWLPSGAAIVAGGALGLAAVSVMWTWRYACSCEADKTESKSRRTA